MSVGTFVIGPLWFAWALLLFALGFTAWRHVWPERLRHALRPLPPPNSWLFAALGVGVVSLNVRQVVPVGESVLGLQLGYFASYVFPFALGCLASRHRWLEKIERRQAVPWAWVTLCTLPLLFVAAAWSGALEGRPVNFNGGMTLPAVVYAFWEPFVAWGVIATLLLFRERFNAPSAAWQAWGALAYGAFIVHAPVVVGASVALAGWEAWPLLKFGVVGSVSVMASFAVAALLLRLPGARRVL